MSIKRELCWIFIPASVVYIGTIIFQTGDEVINSLIWGFAIYFYRIFFKGIGFLIKSVQNKERQKHLKQRDRKYSENKVHSALTRYAERHKAKKDLTNCKEILLSVSSRITFFADDIRKEFGLYKEIKIFSDKVYQILQTLADDKLDLFFEDLENDRLPQCLENCYDLGMFQSYNFEDLVKIDFVDKSYVDKHRTYTIESKADSAYFGALIGDILNSNVFDNYDVTGAIIGASGERKITEKIRKTKSVSFDVTMYFNNLNTPVQTVTVYDETKLRELLGALEYIINNK